MNTKQREEAPAWVPSTHHQVPQPAGHECAAWYEYAQPSACEILYALAHVKAERDRQRAINGKLLAALRQIALEDPTREYAATIARQALAEAKEGA